MCVRPIGSQLRSIRKRLGLSQSELADILGTNQVDISRRECDRYGTTVAWLQNFVAKVEVTNEEALALLGRTA